MSRRVCVGARVGSDRPPGVASTRPRPTPEPALRNATTIALAVLMVAILAAAIIQLTSI